MKEAGIKAGYSYGARNIYRANTRRHIEQIFREQGVTRDSLKEAYEECVALCKKKGDYSTLKATIDSLAKLFGHLKDTQNANISIFQQIEKELLGDKSVNKPIITTVSNVDK
jgi:hypothetical protein